MLLHPYVLRCAVIVVLAVLASVCRAAPIEPPDQAPPAAAGPNETEPDEAGDPSFPPAAAVAAFAGQDIEGCLAELRAAVAKNPALPPPRLVLAGMLLGAGKTGEARQLLEAAAAEKSQHPELRLALATLAINEGRLADAEAQLDKLDGFQPPASWASEYAQKYRSLQSLGRVEIAERRGNWETASEHLETLVEQQPKNSRLRDRWASALFMCRRETTAFEQFDIAHQQDSSINPPEVSMAAMHAQRREFSLADEWFSKAQQKYPDSPNVNLEWAATLLVQGRAEEARQHTVKAAELGLESPVLLRYQGIIDRQLQNWSDAENNLRAVLEKSPRDREANYHLILTLAERNENGSRNAALKLAQEFVQRDPSSPQAHAALGAVHELSGRHAEAFSVLQRAISVARPDAEAQFFAGRAAQAVEDQAQTQRIAAALRAQIDAPGTFVARERARKWLADLAAGE